MHAHREIEYEDAIDNTHEGESAYTPHTLTNTSGVNDATAIATLTSTHNDTNTTNTTNRKPEL